MARPITPLDNPDPREVRRWQAAIAGNTEPDDPFARYRAHLVALVDQFHLRVWLGSPERGSSGAGAVGFPLVLDEGSYAVGLHEIAHTLVFCSPEHAPARIEAEGWDQLVCLKCETSAWTWARDAALEWTPAMDAKRITSETGYIAIDARLRAEVARREAANAS